MCMRSVLLTEWLNQQAEDRGWSYREMARRAGLSHSAISNVVSGVSLPGWDFCLGISRATGEDPIRIFRLAGLLPPAPPQDRIAEFREIAEMLAGLPDGPIRAEAMAAIRAIAESARARATREKGAR